MACFLIASILLFCNCIAIGTCETLKYAIILDAGSTGTRGCIVTWSKSDEDTKFLGVVPGLKVKPGLSDFRDTAHLIPDYLLPIFEHASSKIPAEYYNQTEVYVKGTAGFRLLSNDDQDLIWQSVMELNNYKRNPFSVSANNLGTINGHDEAYYAALSANYIAGAIDSQLRPIPSNSIVGALDMGGASTQLILHNRLTSSVLTSADFWSHSWLGYGTTQLFERAMSQLSVEGSQLGLGTAIEGNSDIDKMIVNPCLFNSQIYSYTMDSTLSSSSFVSTHIGSGDAAACTAAIGNILWPEKSSCVNGKCIIDNVESPGVAGQHFFAMSSYFYTFDCIRQLGPHNLTHWPRPSIRELTEATQAFCGVSWSHATANYLGNKHSYTEDYQISRRCLKAYYILTLLERGFGFDIDARDITFALKVNGQEVDWSLGFGLEAVISRTRQVPGLDDHAQDQSHQQQHMIQEQEQQWEFSDDEFMHSDCDKAPGGEQCSDAQPAQQ